MSARSRSGITIAILAIVLIGIFAVSSYIRTKNSIISLDEDINGAWAEIDNRLKRRSDLIPNLVETVKGYAKQEQTIFTEIANARAKLAGAASVGEKADGYNQLEGALSRLLVIVENYPDLKSNQNFIRLQDELAGTENRIAVARKRYNDKVRVYNTRIRRFPGSMIANSMGVEVREYFEIEESARVTPKVDFGG